MHRGNQDLVSYCITHGDTLFLPHELTNFVFSAKLTLLSRLRLTVNIKSINRGGIFLKNGSNGSVRRFANRWYYFPK